MAKGKILAAVAALAMVSPAMAGGDAEAGKSKSGACAACHGVDGNSAAPTFPKIAGQHADYAAKQLADFKSGARQNALMAGQVANLSEQDMADLSAYFATQKANIGKAKEETLAQGEAIYRGGIAETGAAACMACHGANGTGVPGAGFPQLGGQFSDYTKAQLLTFRDGSRNNDANSIMRDIAKRMTDAEIQAVSDYIEGLN
ncbi:MAG: c-type cytochrome [Granulosicoccaceae bacterium]